MIPFLLLYNIGNHFERLTHTSFRKNQSNDREEDICWGGLVGDGWILPGHCVNDTVTFNFLKVTGSTVAHSKTASFYHKSVYWPYFERKNQFFCSSNDFLLMFSSKQSLWKLHDWWYNVMLVIKLQFLYNSRRKDRSSLEGLLLDLSLSFSKKKKITISVFSSVLSVQCLDFWLHDSGL